MWQADYASKSISKRYMPILQVPRRGPVFGEPISISVKPVWGSSLDTFRLGILTDEEQSNEPFVLKRTMVGIPALAVESRGEYPPLALISMICLPSTILTLLLWSAFGREDRPLLLERKMMNPETITPNIRMYIAPFMML